MTPAYAVEVRHSADHARQQATDQACKDPVELARKVMKVLPTAVSVLPPDEAREALNTAEAFML